MSDHFACIGLNFSGSEAFGEEIVGLAESSALEPGALGRRALWEDDSGAKLAIFLNSEAEIECVKPSFAGNARMLVRPVGMLDDPDRCPFCGIASVEVLEDGEMLYPLFVELEDVHLGPLPLATPMPLFVVGFAEELTVWSDEAAYEAAHHSGGPKFAARSLIPSGTFRPDGGERPPRAEAIATGIVTKAKRRTNRHTGTTFDSCTMETLAAQLDVVAAPQMRPFEVGNVIQGTVWLIARRASAPAHERRGLRRLFRRHGRY